MLLITNSINDNTISNNDNTSGNNDNTNDNNNTNNIQLMVPGRRAEVREGHRDYPFCLTHFQASEKSAEWAIKQIINKYIYIYIYEYIYIYIYTYIHT